MVTMLGYSPYIKIIILVGQNYIFSFKITILEDEYKKSIPNVTQKVIQHHTQLTV